MNKLFVDMDMVLTNFEQGYSKISGFKNSYSHLNYFLNKLTQTSLEKERIHNLWHLLFWTMINLHENFWESLEPMDDAHILINFLKNHNFTILTLAPDIRFNYEKAKMGKEKWLKNFLNNHNYNSIIIPIDSYDFENRGYLKSSYCENENDILIDDSETNINAWKDSGGIGILHTSAENTIKELQKYV